MKVSLAQARAAYERASPISRIHADAPPFFVIHGTHDTLVPVAEAGYSCDRFRSIARAPIVYAEIPRAQHAFEIFPSIRSVRVIHGVERFLAYLYSEYVRASGHEPVGVVSARTHRCDSIARDCVSTRAISSSSGRL